MNVDPQDKAAIDHQEARITRVALDVEFPTTPTSMVDLVQSSSFALQTHRGKPEPSFFHG